MIDKANEPTSKGRIGIIPGSWETGVNWGPLSDELAYQGYTPVVVNDLPVQDPSATRSDHVRVAANALSKTDAPLSLLVAYSGGGLIVEETIKVLKSKGVDVHHIAYLSASLGQPADHTRTDPLRGAIPPQRNSQRFRDSIETLADGTTIMGRRAARELLFGKVPRSLARIAIKSMQPQFRLQDPPLPEVHEIPGTYIWDPRDPVRDEAWVYAVTKALGLNTIKLDGGGHAIHLARPKALAPVLGALAGPRHRSIQVPRQRETHEDSYSRGFDT
ncbi:MAG TPA: alpha/beta hydrolase [Candidatus Saccharimonadales bacterium]